MTLRYEDHKPVGLDWSVCTDGTEQPEVWAGLKSSAPDESTTPSRLRLSPQTEARIVRLYRDDQMSALKVAAEVGCRSATVFKVLKRHNVPSRSRSEGMKLSRGTA